MISANKTFWLAVFVVSYILALCTAAMFVPIPESGEKYADMVIPFILGSGFGVIISMFFGTSEGSKAKNATIASLADKQSNTVANIATEVACPAGLVKPPEPPKL